MILKIQNKPDANNSRYDCWIFVDGIEKVEISRCCWEDAQPSEGFYMTRGIPETEEKRKKAFVVMAMVKRYGRWESYAIDSCFYILSDVGKTIEKIIQ